MNAINPAGRNVLHRTRQSSKTGCVHLIGFKDAYTSNFPEDLNSQTRKTDNFPSQLNVTNLNYSKLNLFKYKFKHLLGFY